MNGIDLSRHAAETSTQETYHKGGPFQGAASGGTLGFISAAAAASWAGAAPGPNLCWYYTNPSQQQGYWDACP
jgi:hypothetical protein